MPEPRLHRVHALRDLLAVVVTVVLALTCYLIGVVCGYIAWRWSQ